MKISHCAYAAILSVPLLVFSCSDFSNLSKPKKVNVKATNQSYSFSAGSGTVKLSDHFNASTLLDNIKDNAGESAISDMAVYDYWPGGSSSGGTTQKFLFNYPVATIPLDFGEYLNNLDLMSELSDALSQTISVPELGDVGFNQVVTLPDVNELISDNFSIADIDLPVPEPGMEISLNWLPMNPISITISSPDFATMEFTDGVMRINLTRKDSETLSSDFKITAKVQLLNTSDRVVAESETTELQAGGTLELPLAGKSLVPSMKLKFVGTYGGGVAASQVVHTYTISTRLAGVQLSKVTGLTMKDEDLADYSVTFADKEIPMSSLGSYIKSATIGEGGLLVYGVLPDGWTGITCTPSLTIADSGSLNVSGFADKAPADQRNYLLYKYADLAGQTIDPTQSVTMGGSIALSLKNATVVLSGTETQTIDLIGSVSIASVSTAVIDMQDLLGDKLDPVTKSQPMGDSVTRYVKSVGFTEIGATATITTDLPAQSLVFGTTVTSDMFDITGSDALTDTATLENGSGTLSLTTAEGWSKTIIPTDDMVADFTMQMTVGALDSSGNSTSEVTFTNLEFGKDYSLAVSFELTYDWDSIVLNTAEAVSFEGAQRTGLDLQSMMEDYLKGEQKDMLNHIKLSNDMIAYLSVTRPAFTPTETVIVDPLDTFASLFGAAVAIKTYSNKEGETVEDETVNYLLGSATDKANIRLVETNASLASYADENLLITKNLFTSEADYSAIIAHTEDSAGNTLTIGLSDILNDHVTDGEHTLPADLEFIYEVGSAGSDEISLTKSDVEALTASGATAELGVNLSIVFPLEFTVTESTDSEGTALGYGIRINDVLDLAGQAFEEGEDVFKREDPDDSLFEKFEKYGAIVKQVALTYKLANNTGLDMTGYVTLIPDDAERELTALVKKVEVDGKEHTLYLSNDEVMQILSAKAFPFQPKISLDIASGTVTVPRNGQFTAAAAVTLILDGTVTVYDADED